MAQLLQTIKQRFFDANGEPLAGGKLYSYDAGTSTPRNTYNDQSGGVANANPTILDSSGYADIWLDTGSYKFVLKDSNDVTQFTVDNVSFVQDSYITTDKIADGAVTTIKIADVNVTTAKIADSNVTTAKIADGAITQDKRASLGQQLSNACTLFSLSTSGVETDITNLSVSITTTGRPVFIGFVHDGSGNDTYLLNVNNPASNASDLSPDTTVAIVRGSTKIAKFFKASYLTLTSTYIDSIGWAIPHSVIWTIDVPAAGTYTYKATAYINSTNTQFQCAAIKLIAFEL